MSDKEIIGNVPITNSLLITALDKVIVDGDEDMITLFEGMLKESPKGVEWFFKVLMGGVLPAIPEKGTEIYVPIEKLGWRSDKAGYEKSHYNKHGFIKATVTNFTGFHNYTPVIIELPPLDSEGPQIEHVDILDIKWNDEDLYDKDNMPF